MARDSRIRRADKNTIKAVADLMNGLQPRTKLDRKAFLKKLRDPKDPYNTRLRPGLPPTAIGNPAIDSLKAALAPTPSEFWYYLHDSEQNLHPARNANEHEANRAKYNVY